MDDETRAGTGTQRYRKRGYLKRQPHCFGPMLFSAYGLRAGSGNSAADGANRSANHHAHRAGNQANQGTCHTAAEDTSDDIKKAAAIHRIQNLKKFLLFRELSHPNCHLTE